ncbi:MAG: DUF1295 domain-containing protein [Epsilonproteobacteria bacterium]|nr:DUF1295 domain-containing protein [Campylobacterota bacterium]
MKQKNYSYLLVSLQYIFMAILLYLNGNYLLQIVPLGIFIVGFIIGIYAIYNNQLHNFNIISEIKDGASLVTHGMYKYIRHPMYFSVILMMFGVIIYNINIRNIVIYLLLVLVVILKAKKEELLWNQTSSQYSAYKEKTKMIIPFIL